MIAQMTAKNGIRMSSSRVFIRPVIDRPNLHVMLNTTATKVLIHPKSKNAQGVEVVDALGHTMKILAKKEVIVAGGAVNSPQILMLSGVGPKEELTRVRKYEGKFQKYLNNSHYFFKIRLEFVQLLICPELERIFTITSHFSQTFSSTTLIHRH